MNQIVSKLKMRIVQHVDETVWRAFLGQNTCANIFHTPEMMQVFAQTEGFKPDFWAALGDDDQMLALFLPVQVTVLDRPLLRKLTTRSVLYGSVLCAPTAAGREALDLLLKTYKRMAKNQVLFTELRNMGPMDEFQPILTANEFVYEEYVNYLIPLTRSQADMWDAIRSNAQRNVRKARKAGVVIEEVQDKEGVTAAYAVLQQVYKRIQVPLPDESLFQAKFDILYPQGMFKILLAKVEGEIIGALTLLIYNGVMTYWYTGTLREFSSYRASDYLVWYALEFGRTNGYHTFDFGGGGKPDEEYGVRDFKAKFGGNLVSYGRNVCVHAPLRMRVTEFGYQLLRRFL